MPDAAPDAAQTQTELAYVRGSVAALAEVVEQLLLQEMAAPPVRYQLRIAT